MRTIRFLRWEVTDDLSFSALLPLGHSTCGIYVLEFKNGDLYVGQTVSLLSRIATHRRTWPRDVRAVRFARVSPEELDRAEQDVIARLVADGERLRNVDLVTLPLRGDALDLVVDHAVQEAWLDGETVEFDVESRIALARQRERTEAKYRRLTQHPEFDAIVRALGCYLRTCVPQPDATEWRFWSLTSLPSTGDGRRLAALSVNNVEVLVLRGSTPDVADEGFLNLAADAEIPRRLHRRTWTHRYRSTGEVTGLELHHPRDVEQVLADPEIAAGARRLALGLLRKGLGVMGRFHDFHLADAVFRV
ncbi:GIY-YIG nuclease family protein [Salana multivorans]